MPNKEEILRSEYEKMFSSQKYDKSVTRTMNFEYISPAMDEYAKQQVIEFAEFIKSNNFCPNSSGYWFDYTKPRGEVLFYDSVELYKKFLHSIKP